MSYYVADVGEIIIKPEHRKDFGHFFRREYDRIEREPLRKFTKSIMSPDHPLADLLNMSEWSCKNIFQKCEGNFKTSYNKEKGIFVYGVSFYSGSQELLTELLSKITEAYIDKTTIKREEMARYPICVCCSELGMVIIKPEYREDFDFFFHGQYSCLQTELMKDFVEKHLRVDEDFIELRCWKHNNEYEDWRGKYQTSYDEDSGLFVFGVTYNMNSQSALNNFFEYILPELIETEISRDSWAEDV